MKAELLVSIIGTIIVFWAYFGEIKTMAARVVAVILGLTLTGPMLLYVYQINIHGAEYVLQNKLAVYWTIAYAVGGLMFALRGIRGNKPNENKKFFHQKHPLLDRWRHPFESGWERETRHLELENPEAYKKMRRRMADQMGKIRSAGGFCP